MSGPVPFIYFAGRPVCNFSSAVRERRRGEFWSRHGKQSENRTIRDAARTARARCLRFDFKAGFYAVFCFNLEHHLHYILNFRDDISGGKRARGLTTWDLIHRAGPALMERAPRPSFFLVGQAFHPEHREGQPVGFPFENSKRGEAEEFLGRLVALLASRQSRTYSACVTGRLEQAAEKFVCLATGENAAHLRRHARTRRKTKRSIQLRSIGTTDSPRSPAPADSADGGSRAGGDVESF